MSDEARLGDVETLPENAAGRSGSRLEGKTAIVSGAGSSGPGFGTGKAISVLFAREGANVLLLDSVEARAKETLDLITEEGGRAHHVRADITKPDDCAAAVEAAVSEFGAVDILVNNVGFTKHSAIVDISEDDLDMVLDINVKGAMLMGKYAIPEMRRAGGGAIVNIGSIGALRPSGGHIAYDAAKGAVISLTSGFAAEEGGSGIRANCILPGRIVTPLMRNLAEAAGISHEQSMMSRRINLLGTLGSAWDIAWAALYLASDEARWVTGVTIPIDGGYLQTPAGFRVPDGTGQASI